MRPTPPHRIDLPTSLCRQVTWADTCAVGCAAAKCDKILFGLNIKKGHVIVCNYGPGQFRTCP